MDYIQRNYRAFIDFLTWTSGRFENVCIPLKSNSRFDVVGYCSTDSRKLSMIKIICTETKRSTGSYEANLLVSGGYNKRKEKKNHFDPSSCHYVFIWTPEWKYLIPTTEITQKKALILSEFEDFKLV